MNEIKSVFENVRKLNPLVHCITNYVTANDCANIILSCGASPIMADDPMEVAEITAASDSLVINIGTINAGKIEAMIMAGRTANRLNIPVILDPVGAGISKLRKGSVERLLKEVKFSVIRGNASEIKAMTLNTKSTSGVDVQAQDKIENNNLEEIISIAKGLSKKTSSVIAISGEVDIVVDKDRVSLIRNGHPYMSKITGTGCMLTSVIGAFCGANKDFIMEGVVTAIALMGICGEEAYKKISNRNEGVGSFKTYLLDNMSLIDTLPIKEVMKVEIK